MSRKLPTLVRAYVDRSILGSRSPTGTVLQQAGEIRLRPEQGWMPFTAEQVIEATCTRFVWRARVRMFPLVTAVVEDAFEDGAGRLDARLWGVWSVAHGRGPDVDRGELMRYLAELPWCPHAFLHNPELELEPIASNEVRASIGDASVSLHFDDDGDIVAASTEARPTDDGALPWGGTFYEYRTFDGLRVPSGGEVSWERPDGPFCYWRGTVVGLRAASGSQGRATVEGGAGGY